MVVTPAAAGAAARFCSVCVLCSKARVYWCEARVYWSEVGERVKDMWCLQAVGWRLMVDMVHHRADGIIRAAREQSAQQSH